MKIAAWQAALEIFEPADVVARLRIQLDRCEVAGLEVLCCPETVLGGLGDGSNEPSRYACGPGDSGLLELLAPVVSSSVILIIGFTERDADGRLYNSAAVAL